MTKDQVEAILANVPDDKKPAVVCSLVGHSQVVTGCLGYVYCGRCGQQIGDTLGSICDLSEAVIVGHDRDVCRCNYDKLGWEHKLLTPDPFKEKV